MVFDDTDEHRPDGGSGDRYRAETDDSLDGTDGSLEEGETPTDARADDGTTDEDGDGVRTTAVEEVDQRIVDLLSWILDTETRAKIYVHLLAHPGSTSEEVAKGTGLYPSTVREALAELHDEERVTREKRANEGAGNNPYEYTAIQPSELVGGVVDQVQQELNTIFTLDRLLERRSDSDPDHEPVTITVNDTEPPAAGVLEDARDEEGDPAESEAETEDETSDNSDNSDDSVDDGSESAEESDSTDDR